MLGISFGEILIIGTIGLLVIGPKRLPETARFIGHIFGRMQRQINSVKADIRREMALEDMKRVQQEYEQSAATLKNAFDQAAEGVPPAESIMPNSIMPDSIMKAPADSAPATDAPAPTAALPSSDTAAEKTVETAEEKTEQDSVAAESVDNDATEKDKKATPPSPAEPSP